MGTARTRTDEPPSSSSRVAIFQFGWRLHALNLGQAGPVESFLPVLMLSVLFGLSMDYEVFLVSRIREEWAAGRDNRQAVTTGQILVLYHVQLAPQWRGFGLGPRSPDQR